MKKNLLFIIAILTCAQLSAQGGYEGFRFSSNELTGTARGQAMGGAFGALGGDPTGITLNPGGLGIYRSSEVTGTINLGTSNIESTPDALWEGPSIGKNKSVFNFNNLSLVGYFPTGNNEGARTVNFSFVYNRLKDFNRKYTSSSSVMGNSITDYMALTAEGFKKSEITETNRYNPYFESNIFWLPILGLNGNFISPLSNTEYTSYFPTANNTASGNLNVWESGKIESYDFSLGTNFSNELFLGATASLTNIEYKMESIHEETFKQGGAIGLENHLRTEGYGYQLKLGAIWVPTDFLRFGLSFHSPTWYNLTDTYKAYTDHSLEGTASTPTGRYEYRFNTPSTWIISGALLIATDAILSLDYEVRDYRAMDYRNENNILDNFASSQNYFIDSDYRVASTIRIGAEYKFTPQLSVRLGGAFMQNPYEESYRKGEKEEIIYGTATNYTIQGDATYATAGFGYRFTPQIYLDIAFIYKEQTDKLYYFSPVWNDNQEVLIESLPSKLKNKNYKGLVTLGYKF